MLTIYESNGKGLKVHDPAAPITGNCVWFDLLQPTQEEDRFVEEALNIEIPTRAEMREIEPSNRFYQERGDYFMTASITYNVEAPVPTSSIPSASPGPMSWRLRSPKSAITAPPLPLGVWLPRCTVWFPTGIWFSRMSWVRSKVSGKAGSTPRATGFWPAGKIASR